MVDIPDLEKKKQLLIEIQNELVKLAELSNIKVNIETEDYKTVSQQLIQQDYLNKEQIKNTVKLLDKEAERLKLAKQIALADKDFNKQTIISIQEAIKANEQKKKQLTEERELLTSSLKQNLGIKEEVTHIGLKLQEVNKIREGILSQEDASNLKQQLQNQIISNITEGITKLSGLILDKALEFESATRSLMRAGTFTFEESKTGLIAVTQQAAIAGVGLKEASAAMVGLKTSFTGFTNLTGAQQSKITALTATMERMGLSINASAKFLDTATKSLGMSTTQAAGFLSSLEGFAKQSGIPLTELSKNLEGATDKIALFGDKGTEVFKEMSLASKQLGIEMNTLFNITERFTTFEGAADAAGKLNAVLGGDFINSVDLLTASMEDPAEAFKMLKMSMDQSGKSFDEMDNGMKRVIASSIGMTVEQAGKLFSQDINTATAAMREQAKTQEQLAKIGANLSTITEKFQNALVALYPTIEPVIDALETFGMFAIEYVIKPFIQIISFKPVLLLLQGFGMAIVALGGILAAFGTIFIPFYSMFISYQKVMSIARKETELFSFLKKKDALASIAQAEGQTAANVANAESVAPTTMAGNAAKMSAKGFMLMGAGILMIGAGIALVIGSIALLASQIKDLSSTQMANLMIITAGVVAGFLIFAIAAMKLTPAVVGSILAIGGLTLAMTALAIPVSIISSKITNMATKLAEMGISIKNASTELLKLGSETIVGNFEGIALAFERISESINNIDNLKMSMLGSALSNVGGTVFVGTTPQQGRAVDFSLTVSDQATNTSTTIGGNGNIGGTQNQVIQLTLDIKSPIMLDKDKIGSLNEKVTKQIIASANTPGITTNG